MDIMVRVKKKQTFPESNYGQGKKTKHFLNPIKSYTLHANSLGREKYHIKEF